jgi:peptidoglycan hydrolase CwlO-like protein
MEKCNRNHDEIIYDDASDCPFCLYIVEKDEEVEHLETVIQQQREDIKDLEEQLSMLEAEVEEEEEEFDEIEKEGDEK